MKNIFLISLLLVLLTACAAPVASPTATPTLPFPTSTNSPVPPSEIPTLFPLATETQIVSSSTAEYSGWVEKNLNTSNETGGFTDSFVNGNAGGVIISSGSIEIDENEILTTGIHEINLSDKGKAELIFEYVFTNYFYHGPVQHKTYEKPTDEDRDSFRSLWIAAQQPGSDSCAIQMKWIVNDLQTPEYDEKPMKLQVFGAEDCEDIRAIRSVRIIWVDPDKVDGNIKEVNHDWHDSFSVNVDGDNLIIFVGKNDNSAQRLQAVVEFFSMLKDFIRFNDGSSVRIRSIDKDFVKQIQDYGLNVK